jgi:hypothetical protein
VPSASDYETVVQSLYVAYFGKPADPTGLTNFENALAAADTAGTATTLTGLNAAYSTNSAIAALVDSFGSSAASVALYGAVSSESGAEFFVNSIFENGFNHSESGAGLNFWINAVLAGDISQGDAALQIAALAGTDDAATLAAKVLAAEAAACYCCGTLIATGRGQVPVEDLAIGDIVATASGALRPIKWIGRRSYDGRFIMGRKDLLPICFKAGSLDDNVPKRDLWISPHHAMYLNGVLIEAKDLVNGVSIVQAEHVDKVEYVHIELESHDVIIAEGALSETFIDDNSRSMFQNAHEYRLLYPDAGAGTVARYCAPRAEDGFEVETARQRIALRAGLAQNGETAQAGDLRGCLDRVTPQVVEGWAQNIDHPEAPVCLDIFAGGRLIGQVLANRYRQDLERTGIGSGRHAFRFRPPAGLVFAHDAVEVRRSFDGAVLATSEYGKKIVVSGAA